MISDLSPLSSYLSPDLDLVPDRLPSANGGEQSVATSAKTDRQKAGCSDIHPARGGDVRTAHPLESEIFAAARPVVVKQILSLLGKDIPDPLAHARYLDALTFADLCSRRDQLVCERAEQLRREELNRQPELSPRPERQMRIRFNADGSRQ